MAGFFDIIMRSIIGRDIGLDRDGNLVMRGSKLILAYDSNPVEISSTTSPLVGLSLVPSSPAAAGANTTAIQAALALGGVVNITQAGTFYINATLIGGDNTTLVLGPLTTLILASGSNCAMFMPASLQTFLNAGTTLGGGTVVTLTQGTAGAVNVQWTGHGLVVGQGCWLAGSTVSVYNGVFRVAAVVDANNLTVYTTKYSASAPSGTIRATKATQNLNLIGGTWDYSGTNQTTTGYGQTTLLMVGLIDSTIDSVNSINSLRAGFQVQGVLNFRYSNLKANQPAAGALNIYGPATSIKGDGLSGVASSGFLVLEPNVPSPSNAFQFSAVGNLHDLTLVNTVGNCQSGALIAINASDNEAIDAVHIEQVNGTSLVGAAINVTRVAGATVGSIGRLTFKNCQAPAEAATTPVFQFQNCTIDVLTIEDCSAIPGSTTTAGADNWLSFAGSAAINTIVMNRIRSSGWPSTAGSPIFIFVNGAQIVDWVLRDCVLKSGTTGQCHFINFGSTANTIGNLTFDGGYYDVGVSELVYISTLLASGTPNITLNGVNLNNTVHAVRTSVAQNLHLRLKGNSLSPSTAVFTSSAANTVKVSSDGANDFNTGVLLSLTGSGVVSLFGYDMTFDAGLLAATKGQYFSHASAVSGRNATNQQGNCVGVDGTHFYAEGTGASGVNTLIL